MRTKLSVLLALGLFAASCTNSQSDVVDLGGEAGQTVILLTHDSFAISDSTLAAFTEATGISVELLVAGDGVETVNRAILTKNSPEADLLFGVDNTVLTRALDENIFLPYSSKGLDSVLPELLLDEQFRVTPIDFGDVCLNYDVAWFEENGVRVPSTLDDLIEPIYRDLLVVEDPSRSSPGLAFLLATIDRYGESGWQQYWNALRENGVEVVSGWSDAYYGSFTVGGGGSRPLVVSYASSPPAQVYFSDPQPDIAPTGVILDSCYRQIEFVGILAGTQNEAAAQVLIDFMLGPIYQRDIPLNQFVFPAVLGTELPQVFLDHAQLAANPFQLDPEQVEMNRDRWVKEWTDLVLR